MTRAPSLQQPAQPSEPTGGSGQSLLLVHLRLIRCKWNPLFGGDFPGWGSDHPGDLVIKAYFTIPEAAGHNPFSLEAGCKLEYVALAICLPNTNSLDSKGLSAPSVA